MNKNHIIKLTYTKISTYIKWNIFKEKILISYILLSSSKQTRQLQQSAENIQDIIQ